MPLRSVPTLRPVRPLPLPDPAAAAAPAAARRHLLALLPAALLAACVSPPAPPPPAPRPPRPAPPAPVPAPVPAPPPPPSAGGSLPPPRTPRSLDELRLQAAQRIVAASPPGQVYEGPPPDMMLAIPVLKVELHADGSIRHIEVMRRPSNARAQDTVDLALAAVRRAAPFGNVARLPRPWVFNETFLFDAQRRFRPMTLVR